MSDTNSVGCHDGHESGDCCCRALASLAHAASAVHEQHCRCEKAGDCEGCACCEKSLEHVLAAMELHIGCLRGICAAKAARRTAG